jgi:pyrimidine operon attenuation protein / uracil phosphoribosyltransferase
LLIHIFTLILNFDNYQPKFDGIIMSKIKLLNSKDIEIILHRLACQLIENHNDFKETVLIGLQPRGSYLAKRLTKLLQKDYNIKNLESGLLDITFFRDDFRRRDEPLAATSTEINFLIEDKKVVIIDDVLYSGRSVRSALTALQSYGRPKNIELLVLIDRRFSRHLPIQPNYRGRQVDAINEEKVLVTWTETHKKDAVYIEHR